MERFSGFADAEGKFFKALAKKNERDWFQAHQAEFEDGWGGFAAHSHDSYKRVPKGYDPDHPRAEMLKMKGLTVGFPTLPKGILATPKVAPWLANACKTTAPFVEWLAFATA